MFKLTLVTPDKKLVFDQEIDFVIVPGANGELDLLPGHTPLITLLETGILRWKLSGEEKKNRAVVSWGYCEVHPQGVNILADIVEFAEDIEVEESKKRITLAEKKLGAESLDDESFALQQREMARGRAEIQLLEEHP